METTLKEVQQAEEALNELQAKAESNLDVEKEMAEAKERKRKAEEAHKQEMKNIQARKASIWKGFQSISPYFQLF